MAKTNNWTTPCLITVIAIQWILFTVLLQQQHVSSTIPTDGATAQVSGQGPNVNATATSSLPQHHVYAQQLQRRMDFSKVGNVDFDPGNLSAVAGVFATVIFRAPKWFHLRYLTMIHNALINLPPAAFNSNHNDAGVWKVQVFVNQQWADDNLLPWHPGLQRLFRGDDPRVIVTPLPVSLTQGKPKEVLFSKWFWKSMVADRVVLFSGNGAFCGNQPSNSAWNDLLQLDYCGAPSHNHHGVGGDGSSHSIRNRNAMLRVIDYATTAAQQQSRKVSLRDEKNFVDLMIRINQEHPGTFRLATPEQTYQFGGVHNLSDTTHGLVRLPLAVAGTQAQLSYEERDSLLKHCPELKTIFPSLHEPACFGAHPKPANCKATICALQDNIPGHGC